MEEQTVQWDKLTMSLGRNGYIKTSGMIIEKHYPILNGTHTPGGLITVYPLTSKGNQGRSFINIPYDKWPGSIVDAILEHKTILPMLIGIHPELDKRIAEALL